MIHRPLRALGQLIALKRGAFRETMDCKASLHSKVGGRSYEAAVDCLNSLQTNFSIVEAIRKSGGQMNKTSIPESIEWLNRAGYSVSDLNCLHAIHVTGTKGKGSTCAFVASMMKHVRKANGDPFKVGLYTSPHLKSVCERIRINGEPISELKFSTYFFEIWDRLEESALKRGLDPKVKPVYFRFLTLVAWHAFLCEKVDTAIVEVGVGGEYDCTNILESPSVTAVTALGIDHTAILGDTIESIAWHKGGIFKAGVPAITVKQPETALDVLRSRADERGASLSIARDFDLDRVSLGLKGDFQRENACAAIEIVLKHLESVGHNNADDVDSSRNLVTKDMVLGLEQVQWPGRCQHFRQQNIGWWLDGAHTRESMMVAARWFGENLRTMDNNTTRILIFNQQTRNATALLETLQQQVAEELVNGQSKIAMPFDHVIFCTNVTWKGGNYKGGRAGPLCYTWLMRIDLKSINVSAQDVVDLKVQRELADHWNSLDKACPSHVVSSIEEAVELVNSLEPVRGHQKDVFVAGSLHLVGGLLSILED